MSITLLHEDALDFILPFADEEFDHVFTDPPYSKHVHENATTSADRAYGTKHNDLGFEHLSPELRLFVAGKIARAQKWSLIYSDVEGAHKWIRDVRRAGGEYIRSIPWVRWSTPQKSGDRPVQGFEVVLVFWGAQDGSKRTHWHGPGNLIELAHMTDLEELDALRHKAERAPPKSSGRTKHKCAKPLDQALDLIDWFSDPGDRIFDPCAGRGTFGAACAVINRRDDARLQYIGIEIQKKEARLGKARIDAIVEHGDVSDRDATRVERWLATRRVENRPETKRRAARREVETEED